MASAYIGDARSRFLKQRKYKIIEPLIAVLKTQASRKELLLVFKITCVDFNVSFGEKLQFLSFI